MLAVLKKILYWNKSMFAFYIAFIYPFVFIKIICIIWSDRLSCLYTRIAVEEEMEKKRYKIAYITAHKHGGYGTGLQDGVKNGIEEQGHILVNITDLLPRGFLKDAKYYFYIALQIARQLNLDCFIIPVGIINAYNKIATKWDGEYLARMLDPARTIVIEDSLDGYRYIVKDNVSGMRECIVHLIHDHHYKKIAFLAGPQASFGSKIREAVYYEEMKKSGLSTENMLYRGSFDGNCANEVERILLEHPDIEAIACCNDHIAQTVYSVLKAKGLTPGTDIAVTGFDDDPSSVHAVPPLSTVRITSYDLGYLTAYEAVRLCEGLPQLHSTLESRFVKRISCGEIVDDSVNEFTDVILSGDDIVNKLCDTFLNHMIKQASRERRESYRQRILPLIQKAAKVLDENRSLGHVHLVDAKDMVSLFDASNERYLTYQSFASAMSELFAGIAPFLSLERRAWLDHEIAHFHQLIVLSLIERNRTQEYGTLNRQWYITQISSGALTYSDDAKTAINAMLRNIVTLGINDCYILLLNETITYKGAEDFQIGDTVYLAAEIKNGKISVYDLGKSYDISSLCDEFIPDEVTPEVAIMQNPAFTIGALLTGAEMIGIMILGSNDLTPSEIVRVYYQVAFGMKHLAIIKKEMSLIALLDRNNIKLAEESMHDALTQLYNRRGFMHHLEKHLENKENLGKKAILLYMDLDGLKGINDSYGHEEGDFAITETGLLLNKALSGNLVGRLGGDEFLGFLICNEELSTGEAMIRKVESMFSEFNKNSPKQYDLNISIGYREFIIDYNVYGNVSHYLLDADHMLYVNKKRHKAERGNVRR